MLEESALRRGRARRDTTEEGDEDGERSSAGNPVVKLVRMALACEYGRKPIRRGDITERGMLF